MSETPGVGQGEHEHPLSEVRSPDVGRRNLDGARSVSESVQVAPHLTQPPTFAARDVLDDDAARPEGFDDVAEDEPQPGALSGKPGPFAGSGNVLAGEAAAEQSGAWEGTGCDVSNITDTPVHAGPVLREHGAAEGILLNLPNDGTEPGPLEAELQTANA